MDKQKQIEEMVKDLYGIQTYAYMEIYPCKQKQPNEIVAEHLVRKGWIKPDENAVVIPKEISVYTDFTRNINVFKTDLGERVEFTTEQILFFEKLYHFSEHKLRKETAKKFAEKLKEALENRSSIAGYDLEDLEFDGEIIQECIDEICKEITEGKI